MSLRPIKGGRRHRSHAPRLEGGSWGTKKKGEFTPIHRWGKIGILATIIILGVLASSYGYYSNIYLPGLPPSPSHDPYTLLWNGTITGAGTTTTSLQVGKQQSSAPTNDVNLNGGPTVSPADERFEEAFCTGALSSFTLAKISITLKRVGNPTGTVVGQTWSGGLQNVNGNCVFNSVGQADFGTAIDVSTIPTSYTTESWVGSFSIVSSGSNSFAFGIRYHCVTCDINNFLTVGVTNAGGTTNENGYLNLPTDEPGNCAQPIGTAPACPTAYKYQYTLFSGLTCPLGFNCLNSGLSLTNFATLVANATFPSVMLTTSSINTATSASKELLFYETWGNSTNVLASKPFGWFLTVNAALPTNASYNPLTDPSVAMAVIVYPGATNNYYIYQQKDAGLAVLGASGQAQNPYPTCPQAATLYICSHATGSPAEGTANFLAISSLLNFTGSGSTGGQAGSGTPSANSLLCSDVTPANLNSGFCSTPGSPQANTPCSGPSSGICTTNTFPFLNIQGNSYFLGFWSNASQTGNILFGTSNSGAVDKKANAVYYWIPNPSCPPTCSQTDTGGFFGWLGKTLGGAYNVAAGALAPITAPILNVGNSVLGAFASGIIQAGNLLIKGLAVLESILQATMNVVGNAVGLGNVGTSFFQIVNALITFFASGNFNSIFTNAAALFNRLIDSLAIYFPWLPTALDNASRFATLGINSIGFVNTIISFAFQFVSGAFATYLIAFWFIYTGDDSLAGVLGLIETTEFLVFGLGLKYLAHLINFALDVVTNLIGLIPKPLIQMVAHQFPRIPIVEVEARFVWPGGSMTEIKNGNMLAAACWVSGILFLDMYETASPALPGSIGFLLPSAVSALAPLSGFIPLLEIMTAFVWGAAFLMMPIHWLNNAFDFGEVPFDSAVGTRISGGFRGIRFSKAQKRFQGRLEKKIEARTGLKAVKESGASSQGVG